MVDKIAIICYTLIMEGSFGADRPEPQKLEKEINTMKLLNVETIEALDNQTAALLETKLELTKIYQTAEAETRKTQAMVAHMENNPKLYSDEEADTIYQKHDEAMEAFNKADAELADVCEILERLETIVEEMKEFNTYYAGRN